MTTNEIKYVIDAPDFLSLIGIEFEDLRDRMRFVDSMEGPSYISDQLKNTKQKGSEP